MLEQRQWCEDWDTIYGYGTNPGLHYRCRRCGLIIQTNAPGRMKFGPCIADKWPCLVAKAS